MSIVRKLFIRALARSGYTVRRIEPFDESVPSAQDHPVQQHECAALLDRLDIDKVHYACGTRLLGPGWINVDRLRPLGEPPENFHSADLIARHPFPSDRFRYGLAEDFIEHLTQADSLLFLVEAYRTLCTGGVLRVSFPGFESVLKRRFRSADFDTAVAGKRAAYTMWGHVHFYTEATLAAAARHIGFSDIEFFAFNESRHAALAGIDSRSDQRDINVFAELTK